MPLPASRASRLLTCRHITIVSDSDHMVVFLPYSLCPFFVSLKRTVLIGFRAYQDIPGSHLKTLNHIYKTSFPKGGHAHRFRD